MAKYKKWKSLALLTAMFGTTNASTVAVIDETFEQLELGDKTGVNESVTNNVYVAGLRIHNHILGEIVTAPADFTSANEQVFKIKTGINPTGGWGQISADNSPRGFSNIVGEKIILSFDMLVKEAPQKGNDVNLSIRFLKNGNPLTANNQSEITAARISRPFSEYLSAKSDDIIRVDWTNSIPANNWRNSYFACIDFESHPNNFELNIQMEWNRHQGWIC